VTVTVLLIAILAFVAAMTLLGVSQAQMRSSSRSQDRMMGLVLAEAGIDDAVAQISSFPEFTGRSGTIYENPPTNTRIFGTYQTTVTVVGDLKRKITSVGTNPNGSTSTVVALITVETRALGNAALMANGPINVSGTMQVNSLPADLHISNVYANGNIAMGGTSFVDGQLAAAGTVVGQAYYPSESGVPPYPYPSRTTTDKWKTDWIAAAQLGGTINGQVKTTTTITAPKYINGNISLNNSETVVINGPGVVYVNGDVTLTAQAVLTNGATLVVSGTVTQGGQSSYKMVPGVKPTPTMVVYGTGYSATADVIKLAGGSLGDNQGVVYAVNGSINVAGGSTFVGALVAGTAGAQISSNGGYTHYFPEDLASSVVFPTAATISGVTEL
jgi:Tfp pilus assembly protein PilX